MAESIKGASAGINRQLIPRFRRHLASTQEGYPEIYHPELKALVTGSEGAPSYGEALDRIASQITAARDTILYPDQEHSSSRTLHLCYRPEQAGGNIQGWQRLASDAGYLVLSLAIATEHSSQPEDLVAEKVKRGVLAMQTVLALRQMVLALLYQQRATIDEQVTARSVVKDPFQRPQAVVKVFERWIIAYNKQVNIWKLAHALPSGWMAAGDATNYNTWSRDFGRPRDAEIGWGPYARAVRSALRFQGHKMELRQQWAEVFHGRRGFWTPFALLGALAIWAFGFTSGFGLKPGRFVATAFFTIMTFSLAYFADGVLSGCRGMSWPLAGYPRNIYLAIGNLTGVGASPGVCVKDAGALISAESLMGYFLLSVLAAMLFAWLTDR